MAASNTFTWNAGTSIWSTSTNWLNGGGTGAFGTGSAAGNQLLFILGAGSPNAPYTVTVDKATINAGAIDITSGNADLSIATGHLLKSIAGAAAGGTLTMSAGTVTMAGGTIQYTTYSVGGSGEISGFGTIQDPAVTTATLATSGSGEILATGGTLNIVGVSSTNVLGVSGNLEIAGSGTLQFSETSIASGSGTTVNFQSAAGTMSNDNTTGNYTINLGTSTDTFNAALEHMAVGTTTGSDAGASVIDLDSLVVTSGTIVGGSELEVVAGASTFIWNTSGTSFAGDFLNFATDGSGGTDIWVDTHPCYAEGTRILTERGEVAVEALAAGDMVVTLAGDSTSLQPVRWIGERRMNLRQHPQPNLVAPVRVRQHAFGENLPTRDLLLSPDHCLFVDGKLIPAKLLINDLTIVQERATTAVHYYHVELDQHSVMLAEGLPAESYLDTGNRAMFANAGLALVLHPEFAVNAGLKCWETDACAPLTVSQELVKPIWDRLVERAESLGYQRAEFATTTDPELRLVADGRVIRPLSSDANRYVFTLPAGVASVRMTSRASVPSYFEAYLDDWRHLGVAVRRIVVRDSSGLIEIPPDHPGLTQGWHNVERDAATMWRWMNGDAVLPIGPTDGPVMVEIQVGMAMKHVVEAVAQGRLAA